MPQAIIMINVEVGKENDAFEKLSKLNEVKEIYMVYGVHDIIAIVETKSLDDLRKLLTEKIRKMDEVKDTLTSIVVNYRKK
ncbi:Lrp/AsnC ligand binding domain-containing protein [Stetteria hydrogenophila]